MVESCLCSCATRNVEHVKKETETNINIWHAYKIHKIHTLSVCVIYSLKQTATCFRVFFSASTSVFLRQVDGLLVGFPE
jgi:hypothetical protein